MLNVEKLMVGPLKNKEQRNKTKNTNHQSIKEESIFYHK